MSLTRGLVVSVLTLAACGGHPPAPTNAGGDHATAGAASGVGTLAWGASEVDVKAAFPQTTARPEGGLWTTGTTEGIASLTMFKLGAKGLEGASIEWTEGFPDMPACLTAWKSVRGKYDAKFGASQADNGAAYWKTASTHVSLACNPNDSGAGVMSATFEPGTP